MKKQFLIVSIASSLGLGAAFVRAAPPKAPAKTPAKAPAKTAIKPVKAAPAVSRAFAEANCFVCHDAESKKGGLDMTSLNFERMEPREFALWVKVHDRVRDGEMPPPKSQQPTPQERAAFKNQLAKSLIATESAQLQSTGRTLLRRLNRYEYENTVRDLLQAPWLQLKEMLPEDGEAHRFNKVGEALDVSHVQMSRYLQAADYALRQVTASSVTAPQNTTKKYYARDEGAFTGAFDISPLVRRTFAVLETKSDPDYLFPLDNRRVGVGRTVPLGEISVGAKNPARRDQEGVGVLLSTYEPTEIRWSKFRAPVAGRYKLRFMAHTIWIGPTAGKNWWIPNYENISTGRRTEPIYIYGDRNPRILRKIGQFDATPEAKAHELDVWLLQGECIRPDAVRFFRPRPGDMRNPWATPEGAPGVSFRWMEVEGPIYDEYPTRGHKLLFGDLPLKEVNKKVEVVSEKPAQDAEKLLRGFIARVYRRPISDADVARFLPVFQKAQTAGFSFQDALMAAYSAVLCSPGFLYLEEKNGPLDDYALASRLSYFLWNTAPDEALLAAAKNGTLRKPEVLRAQTNRLLDDPKAKRFVEAFLDYWLELRKIAANDPDVLLYPDYQLDDLLVESSVQESQAFFAEMLKRDLPAKNIVASDWAMLNERLAVHYNLPAAEGVEIRRVQLPPDSPRGGLMTQASVLKVTANGTTTSPVLRGVWIMERILGEHIPPPPASVPAVEPDIRGAATIREQLDKHRNVPSCASCHVKIDPTGFALENFDVMGGFRQKYRALGDGGGKFQKAEGIGHNGARFTFTDGLPVDASGQLPDGRAFKDVRDLKQLLAQDDVKLARNLVKQLLVYGTGAPVRFADRPKVEAILNRAKPPYGARTLLHEIVQSELFLTK
jgi:mono/diheme cytochrome c family protein